MKENSPVHQLGNFVDRAWGVSEIGGNAPMEWFWGSMQIELLNRKSWKTILELSSAMAEWIEDFYNPLRRRSSLDYLTPNEYEALHSKETQAAFS